LKTKEKFNIQCLEEGKNVKTIYMVHKELRIRKICIEEQASLNVMTGDTVVIFGGSLFH
jgi:aspartate 1-decarboxylase